MNSDTLRMIDAIARDRKVDRELLFKDLEQAMVSAARKHFNTIDTEEFGCAVDRLGGQITLWRNHVDGSREEIPIESLGRIPAQTAKQVMIQRFREAERHSLMDEFGRRQGELVTGVAHRYDGQALIVQVDRAEGFMPRSEQIPSEQFKPGDRVRCLILEVRESNGQVKIILSRRNSEFIKRLFEAEVPEVAERIIEIKAMAREPGFRTKLAVSSVDSKVDAVGACVGVRGTRIKNIVDELGGEKIDIVRWNESSQVLIGNALKPAEVSEVSLCFELSRATVIVPETELSLAIGKRGQNVRLAARLTGWDIDILTPTEFARGLEIVEQTVKPIEGVTEQMLDRMGALGLISVFDISEVGEPVLCQSIEMGEDVAARVVEACAARAKVIEEERERAKADEAANAGRVDALLRADEPAVEPDAEAESQADSILGGGFADGRSERVPPGVAHRAVIDEAAEVEALESVEELVEEPVAAAKAADGADAASDGDESVQGSAALNGEGHDRSSTERIGDA